jgi:uncharacterized protein YdeI (YjbR/CyaY-like superfamily)
MGRFAPSPPLRFSISSTVTMAGAPENSVHPATREEWRAWLRANHAHSNGVWLVGYRKAAGKPRVEYAEAVEEALCFGWIDSKPGKLDDERTMLWYSPRNPGSGWSALNKTRIERLLAEGKMEPAGLAKIEAAKADGTWTRLDAAESMEVPDDLSEALAGFPDARRHWDAFPPSARKAILAWITTAKTEGTRAKRVEETARLANEKVRANQWRPKQ